MGLIRFLFLLLIAGVAWFAVKHYLRKQELRERRDQSQQRVNKIVRCKQCDVHLPEDQALRDGDEWFCTPAHKQAWLAKNTKS